MHAPKISRRAVLGSSAAAMFVPAAASRAAAARKKSPFRYCLNTSTIRGQKVPLDQEVELAAAAGYEAIEPWVGEIQKFKAAGGRLADLQKRIADHGMTVESAIGFAKWIVDDPAVRAQGLEQARRDMDMVAQIGGIRMAAPPSGATKEAGLDLHEAAKRYRALLELGDEMGVTPMVEVWGFSKNLHRLGDSMSVALESGHPKACLLPDVYHLYKGGSDVTGLGLLSGPCIPVCHMNDYPDIPRETIKDADRVYPGEGVGPVKKVLQILAAQGGVTVLSLELFNKTYYKQDPSEVLKRGLASMKEAVAGV